MLTQHTSLSALFSSVDIVSLDHVKPTRDCHHHLRHHTRHHTDSAIRCRRSHCLLTMNHHNLASSHSPVLHSPLKIPQRHHNVTTHRLHSSIVKTIRHCTLPLRQQRAFCSHSSSRRRCQILQPCVHSYITTMCTERI